LSYLVRKFLPVSAILIAATLGYFANDGGAVGGTQERAITEPAATAVDQTIVGRASVIDGDTIEISGQRIRFNGIDAPESIQRCNDASGRSYACGRKSANALDEFLATSRPVTCEFVDWDQYGRFVGNCARADGTSVQGWLVRNGHALDWPRYSHGAFAAQEATARASKLGVWQGDFQKPWEWRAAQRKQVATSTVTESPAVPLIGQSACNIKGNISAKGERIYHVQGQKFYDRTKISEADGERWFCTEAEARQSGWRKAKR
jgi:endonuclease YncB( thermonuclease family)